MYAVGSHSTVCVLQSTTGSAYTKLYNTKVEICGKSMSGNVINGLLYSVESSLIFSCQVFIVSGN